MLRRNVMETVSLIKIPACVREEVYTKTINIDAILFDVSMTEHLGQIKTGHGKLVKTTL